MKMEMYEVDAVKEMIAAGQKMVLAGDEQALQKLPAGAWIAGTIPYFMAEQGGLFTQDQIHVTELPAYAGHVEVKTYNQTNIDQVYEEAPGHGFSVIIIPASCQTHLTFALNAPNFPGFATRPLIGWIAGVFLDELGRISPKVFDGTQAKALENSAVVFHVELPPDKFVEIDIVNIFEQGQGDTIAFPQDGFSATEVLINGRKQNFAAYLSENEIDTKLPLVADLCGAMINTSFQGVNSAEKRVDFYAPVFEGLQYKIAHPVDDYVDDFLNQVPGGAGDKLIFSCNCILNYLYAELEGKKTADFSGPMTFGEIAYQLLNQTLAYMTIEDAK